MYYNNSFEGNIATDYGLNTEIEATELLSKKWKIYRTGLLVHPQVPWMGYSPDGLLVMNDQLKILEVKCPVQGFYTTATELVKMLNYICIDKGTYALKQKHKYYGQVQCGMHITNADQCYFVIYASCDKSYVLIHVPRDDKFIQNQYAALHNIYFEYFLPYLCSIN